MHILQLRPFSFLVIIMVGSLFLPPLDLGLVEKIISILIDMAYYMCVILGYFTFHNSYDNFLSSFIFKFLIFLCLKGSLGTLVRGVPCDLKVTGSSIGIGHWKQVRPPTIHPSGCGPSPNPAYA